MRLMSISVVHYACQKYPQRARKHKHLLRLEVSTYTQVARLFNKSTLLQAFKLPAASAHQQMSVSNCYRRRLICPLLEASKFSVRCFSTVNSATTAAPSTDMASTTPAAVIRPPKMKNNFKRASSVMADVNRISWLAMQEKMTRFRPALPAFNVGDAVEIQVSAICHAGTSHSHHATPFHRTAIVPHRIAFLSQLTIRHLSMHMRFRRRSRCQCEARSSQRHAKESTPSSRLSTCVAMMMQSPNC